MAPGLGFLKNVLVRKVLTLVGTVSFSRIDTEREERGRSNSFNFAALLQHPREWICNFSVIFFLLILREDLCELWKLPMLQGS